MTAPAPALICLAHGSRHPDARSGIEKLTRAAAQKAGTHHFAAAHLEFNQPELTRAAQRLADAGVTHAVVVPLLFTTGYHITHDVPRAIDRAAAHSGLRLECASELGCGKDIAAILATRAAGRDPGRDDAADVIFAVGSANPCANAEVEQLASHVQAFTGRAATAAFATRGGVEKVAQLRDERGRVRILPLFVTHGLLLERLEEVPGVRATPLGTALAEVVASRYRQTAHRAFFTTSGLTQQVAAS